MPLYAIVCKILLSFVQQPLKKNEKTDCFANECLQLLSWNLQQPFAQQARNPIKRCLVLAWIAYSLFITLLYQGKLSGTLIIPKNRPDINTIAQLEESNYRVMSYPRYNKQIEESFQDSKNLTKYPKLMKRLVNVTQQHFFDTIKSMNVSVAYANKNHINLQLRRKLLRNGEVVYNQMKQCPVPYAIVYGLTYGSPYKGRINYLIRQSQEAGLIEKWDRENQIQEQITQSKLQKHTDTIAFTLSHLQSAFFVYIIGCSIAAVMFFIEMCCRDLRWCRRFSDQRRWGE